ncbi:hypothetical protein BJF82_10295 [Kytococcus sp. CUA-901]|nr:hypothetical protein BJF82_10295 [Kytococcus sp. CUA-901]
MLGHEAVEEDLVEVLQRVQVHVLGQVGRLHLELAVAAAHLVVDAVDRRGDQSAQAEGVALLEGEGRAAVQHRPGEYLPAADGDLDGLVAVLVAELELAGHGRLLVGR